MSATMGMSPPVIANPLMIGGNASVMALATAGLSSNKYILGLMILLINLGARYIGNELNEFSHKVLNHKFARRFLIFLVIWMGSRDLVVSIIITTCFILLSNTLLNEQSTYCILPIDNPSPVSKEGSTKFLSPFSIPLLSKYCSTFSSPDCKKVFISSSDGSLPTFCL